MGNYGADPLNLNLIIPFKDKKGLKKNLLLQRLSVFETQLHERVTLLKEEIADTISNHGGLAIAIKKSRGLAKYYWRLTTRSSKRMHTRLFDGSIQEFVQKRFDDREQHILIYAEEELIYINENLKLVNTIQTSLERVDQLETLVGKMSGEVMANFDLDELARNREVGRF